MLLSNVISKQMEQYAVCNQDFSEMEQEMTSVEDSYDSIAPATQSVELQDEAEGSGDLHPDFNENYNFADDKTHLTKALYQAALKYYNTRAGVDFTEIKVLQ